MYKIRKSIQICKSVVEKGGRISEVPCGGMLCEDCPLSSLNRKDGKLCSIDEDATLEVAKNFLVEVGVLEQKEQEGKKSYSFEEIVLMNLKGGIERGAKFVSDYNVIEILPNRTLKISNLKEESSSIVFPSEMFTMMESYLTVDDFDLEEEFQILGCEGIFKKIRLYGQIKVVRRFDDGRVNVYGEDYLDDDDQLIRVKN